MKKIILVIASVLLCISCSRDSSSEDFTEKVFYGVASASCSPTTSITNLSPDDYIRMSFKDENDNDVSYQPRPNTWYRMCDGNLCMWAKTGNDVSPKDSPISFTFFKTEYSSPCQ
jgi:hypothetical protein